jgi:hypothetical protein
MDRVRLHQCVRVSRVVKREEMFFKADCSTGRALCVVKNGECIITIQIDTRL